jgi:hypothetical protein
MLVGFEIEHGMMYVPLDRIEMITDTDGDGCCVQYQDCADFSKVVKSTWRAQRVYQSILEAQARHREGNLVKGDRTWVAFDSQ